MRFPHEMAAMTRAALDNDWDDGAADSPQISAADAGELHRVESLPVKAVLAMMGKIEEVYRLPLLPMRRDTRSKLQKIATEAGVITKPAAPRPTRLTSTSMRTGWRDRTRSCCIARTVGSAIMAKDARRDMMRTMRSGMARTQPWPKRAISAHDMAGVLIRSECKCI